MLSKETFPIRHPMAARLNAADLEDLAAQLFPIPRSITGNGMRESIEILKSIVPFKLHRVRSGSKVFDWTVPKEWSLKRAQLWSLDDNTLVLDSKKNSLHVLNFSEPFSGVVDLEELNSHLYSLPERPNTIPYVTSYYEPRWGLCLSDNQRQSLKQGKYRVEIDVTKEAGFLEYYTHFLPATNPSRETILLSSYLCHPSMGNNELSGPLAMISIYRLLLRRNRSANYLFYLGPETIGALCFLKKFFSLKRRPISAGLVLTCLGGDAVRISTKLSRRDSLGRSSGIDKLARSLAALDSDHFEIREFDPAEGSDERQYCSPGFNLPVAQVARTIYGKYAEYHSSDDNLSFMNSNTVINSADKIDIMLDSLEVMNRKPSSSVTKGEPFLSSYGLYSNINVAGARDDPQANLKTLREVLSLCDGTMTVFQICSKLKTHPHEIRQALRTLADVGLLPTRFS